MLKTPTHLEEVIQSIKNCDKQSFGVDFAFITFINENIEKLVEAKVVNVVENPAQCTQCGKESTIFLTVKNDDGTALCLDCAGGLEFNKNIVINVARKNANIRQMDLF